MAYPERLETALSRLSSALTQLEAVTERQAKADAVLGDLREEFTMLQEDRSRLADELDAALTRGRALARANGAVASRLDRAGLVLEAAIAAVEAEPAVAPPLPRAKAMPFE